MAIIAYAFLDYNMQKQQPIPLFGDGSRIVSGYFSSQCAIKPHSPLTTKPKQRKD